MVGVGIHAGARVGAVAEGCWLVGRFWSSEH